MVSDNIYLSTVQVVTLYGISLVWVLQSPLGSSLTCSVKYLIGEEPEPPVTQWRWRRRDSTPSWGTDNFLGGWGRSVNGATMVKGKKRTMGGKIRKNEGFHSNKQVLLYLSHNCRFIKAFRKPDMTLKSLYCWLLNFCISSYGVERHLFFRTFHKSHFCLSFVAWMCSYLPACPCTLQHGN